MRTQDWDIIDRCLSGCPTSFGLLVDKYRERVYARACSILGNSHDAEDVTQEVFVKAHARLKTLRKWDSFPRWLDVTTSNHCKNLMRSRSRQPERGYLEEHTQALTTHSVSSYQVNQMCESLYQALDSLPEMQRQLLALHYLGGMSLKEIARLFGTLPNTIKQRLGRARSKLKSEMLVTMDTIYKEDGLPDGAPRSDIGVYDGSGMETTATLSMLLSVMPVLAGTWRDGLENGDWMGWQAIAAEPWQDNVEGRLSAVSGVLSMDAMKREEKALVLYMAENWKNYSLFVDMRILEVDLEAQ